MELAMKEKRLQTVPLGAINALLHPGQKNFKNLS